MFTEGAQETSIETTTDTTICAAPSSGVRRIVSNIHIDNPDNISHVMTVFKLVAGTARRLFRKQLAANESYTFARVTILDNTNETLYAVMAEDFTTESVKVDVSYGDAS